MWGDRRATIAHHRSEVRPMSPRRLEGKLKVAYVCLNIAIAMFGVLYLMPPLESQRTPLGVVAITVGLRGMAYTLAPKLRESARFSIIYMSVGVAGVIIFAIGTASTPGRIVLLAICAASTIGALVLLYRRHLNRSHSLAPG